MNSLMPSGGKRTVQPKKRPVQHEIGKAVRRKTKLSPDEEKHRYILANMEDCYYELDLKGNFTFVNPAACLNLGWDAEELAGMNYRRCITPQCLQKIKETFKQVYRTGTAASVIEYELVQKDGTRRTHEMSVSLLRKPTGQPVGFFGISRDRTEALRLKCALRESEASYRGVMDLCPDSISISAVDTGRYVDVNKAFTRQLGYSADEVLGRSLEELNLYASPEDRRNFDSALRNGASDGLEVRFRSKDGTILDYLVSNRRIQFKGKDCFLFVSTLINPLKEVHKALRESEESYRRLMELAPDAISISRLSDGKYFEVNDTFCHLTGHRREEVIGRTVVDIGIYARPEDREQVVATLLRDCRVEGMEIVFRAKDGTLLAGLVSARIMDFKKEKCVIVIATLINALKEAQKALVESEKRYRTILDAAPDAICLSRLSDGRFIEANRTFYQRTGYSPEEAIGRTSTDLGIYVEPQGRDKLIETVKKNNQVDGLEVPVRYKNGKIACNLWSCRMLRHNDEECLLVFSKEIDDLKSAQRALIESEESYRAILDASPYSITISRISDGRYVHVNNAFCEGTGYSREEAIGHTNLELNLYIDPKDRERLIAALRREGKLDDMEVAYRRKDGSKVEALVSSRPILFHGEHCLLYISTNIDALKKAQRELRESEESYRTILDTAPYTVSIVSMETGCYLLVNEAFCRYTGYPSEEAIGHTPFELDLYDDLSDRQRFLTLYKQQGRVDGMETRIKRKNGLITTSLISARPIHFRGQRCVLIVTTDIDALKNVQRALEESEESYRKVIHTTPNAIAIIRNSDSSIIEVNDAFSRSYGFSRGEAIGRTPRELNLFADPSECRKVTDALLSQGRFEGLEIRFRNKQGQGRENLLSVTPLRYRGEEALLVSSVDVTVLKEYQNALHESEETYRRILESAPYSIIVTRMADSRFIEVNDSFCRRTGFSREETIGRTPIELNLYVNPEDRARLLDILKTQGRADSLEIEFTAKDGHLITNLMSSIPLRFHGEDCMLSMTVDITPRKRAEHDLAQYRQHLEEMVQARTQALETAQSELIKREKLAVLGQLTATVSHELRNPLGVIRSSNFFLQRRVTERDQKIEKHFRRIEEQVALCDAIVADLLEYTRGRSVSMAKQDLTPWLIQVIEQLQESQGMIITQELARPLPIVPHDPEKMRRVIINVLDNAIQAVKTKSAAENDAPVEYRGKITVKSYHAQNRVVIEIIDNGIGMAPDTLQRAFEPLFTTRARGTGIGLAIVKKVVNEHGGDVFLESTLGEGTRIIIALPCSIQSQSGKV